jgi:uncharacterized protein
VSRHALHERAVAARARRTGDLRHDLVVFVQLLRELGSGVSPEATLQALRGLTVVRLDRRDDVRAALGCCLTSDPRERAVFDAVFEPYWGREPEDLAAGPAPDEAAGEGDGTAGSGDLPGQEERQASGRPERRGAVGRATYGRAPGRPAPVRAGRRRDVEELAARVARALGSRPGSREVPARAGERVDLRSSLRANLGSGGELLELRHSRRRRDRPRLAVFCDVSSSMRPSTPLFLAFVHALTLAVRRVESAVFNVDTVLVTEVFRRMSLGPALRWLAAQEVALSGGTRIGHCLHAFLDDLEGRRLLGPDTIALVLSDGWDVGEPELLQAAMTRLRRQVGRVVWCDPHAAAADFRPQVQGLRVALPFVDDHLDFSGVDSLAVLADRLTRPAPPRRPAV